VALHACKATCVERIILCKLNICTIAALLAGVKREQESKLSSCTVCQALVTKLVVR